MADVFTAEKRRWIMGRIKGSNTKPEIFVRSLLHRMGYRFRIHRRDLPGVPDIVLPKHRKVIFVHGCFWHGHPCCPRSKRPDTNSDFWNTKLDKNMARDKQFSRELKRLGWQVIVVWECEIRNHDKLHKKLERFLSDGSTKEKKANRP